MTDNKEDNMKLPEEKVLRALGFIMAGRASVLEAQKMHQHLLRALEVDEGADVSDWVWETGVHRTAEYFVREIEKFLAPEEETTER